MFRSIALQGQGANNVKQKAKALQHFKLNLVLKIEAEFF